MEASVLSTRCITAAAALLLYPSPLVSRIYELLLYYVQETGDRQHDVFFIVLVVIC